MNYMNLIEELAPLNRCHNGPEMHSAYERLIEYYGGATLVKTEPKKFILRVRFEGSEYKQ